MNAFSLNGAWRLTYLPESEPGPQTPQELDEGAFPTVAAQVPGNVELDLMVAGIEPDPFYGDNLYRWRKYEFYHWWYAREFELPADWAGKGLRIVFEGINTYADVFLNDMPVGQCDNMLIAHEFDVIQAVKPGTNRLRVHIRSAMNVARGIEYAAGISGGERIDEMVWQRKPPHCFGWDIMPRLPSAGLWRGVRLEIVPQTRITQTYYATVRIEHDRAELLWKVRFATDDPQIEGFSLRLTGQCGSSRFRVEQTVLFVSAEGRVTIDNPRLWWPRGYGEAALYTVQMDLLHHGIVVDSRTERIGIRRFEVDHKLAPGDEGEFLVRVNGCPILAKGSNWVPLDALHSRDAGRYAQALALADEAGCNMLRC